MSNMLWSLRAALRAFVEATETQSQEHIRPLHAFRNLTNRMEEAAGDCTNIHMTYPAMVYGFLHVLRANPEKDVRAKNDVAIHASGAIAAGIVRYHDAMVRLTGRADVRDDPSRYESVALALVDPKKTQAGRVLDDFPQAGSPLCLERFFARLYDVYDLRFVYAAPALEGRTKRLEWAPDSPALESVGSEGFLPRVRP